MTPTTKCKLSIHQSTILIVSVIPKEATFFWYDSNKDLKACFGVTWLSMQLFVPLMLVAKICLSGFPGALNIKKKKKKTLGVHFKIHELKSAKEAVL